jgi:hypothetical protein
MTATVCNMLCIPASAVAFVGRNRLDAFVRFCRRLYALLHSKCAYNVPKTEGIADMHTHVLPATLARCGTCCSDPPHFCTHLFPHLYSMWVFHCFVASVTRVLSRCRWR